MPLATERGQSLREVVIMTCSTLPGRTGARAHRRGMCGAECSRPRRAGWGRAGAGRRLDMGQTHPQFGRFYAPGRCAPSTPASRGSPCTSACLCIPGNRCAVCGGGWGGAPHVRQSPAHVFGRTHGHPPSPRQPCGTSQHEREGRPEWLLLVKTSFLASASRFRSAASLIPGHGGSMDPGRRTNTKWCQSGWWWD